MAQSLRRPLFSAVGLTSPFERRCFTQIVPRQNISRKQQVTRPAQAPDKSFRVATKERMQIPSDVGLLDGTFVRPTGRNVPSLFQSPRGVFKLQWTWAKSKFRDVFSLFIVKWTSPREKRWYNRTIKINRSQTAPTTIALHQEMYNAFAEGDARALRKICADGIHESFRARIGNRARGEKVVWELVKYNKRAKVMSDRAARLPMDGASIRQAVVRICSSQKLTRYLANGQQVKGTGKERDVVEYVVVQKKYWNYIGEQWQVWGTTEETTLDDVKEWETKSLADV